MVKSEFGKGLIVCLVKFAEHFENDRMRKIRGYCFFLFELKGDKEKLKNYGKGLTEIVKYFELFKDKTPEELISRDIELWANGATDHLFQIEVPEEKEWGRIRREVRKLQDKGLEMGRSFIGETWTLSDVDWLRDQTRKIALMVDKKIGLNPDLGSW